MTILRIGNNSFTPLETIGIQKRDMVSLTGFTLIELMLTVTILTLGLLFILQSFSASIKAAGLSQDITEACILAENKVNELEIRLAKEIDIPLEDQGKVNGFIWTYSLKTLKDLGLSELNFKVLAKSKKEILEIITYLTPR